VLVRVLLRTVTPLGWVPQSWLAAAVDAAVPSPVVLLRGARAAYLLLQVPLVKGLRRVLVRLSDAPLLGAKEALWGPEQRARFLRAPASAANDVAVQDDYEPGPDRRVIRVTRELETEQHLQRHPPPLTIAQTAELQQRERDERKDVDAVAPSLVLALDDTELDLVARQWDGDHLALSVRDVGRYLQCAMLARDCTDVVVMLIVLGVESSQRPMT
jgi:hypothetical protein